ncbi:hypothetical protein BDN72DRAFT_754446 [Pluteus cervinus]|uniref:Uncharacterized protein n=1 Tax=Pluteus cervinus TaxID=181527 RepID=A0ACD3BGV9_9AGAR|nr:hypothetical protein BDN72DRAFT_754446 [Pluteus cervinus]
MRRLTIIVAASKANGIGRHGSLPWRLPKEMKYFARATSEAAEGKQNAVVMGRKTWESIPNKFRPLGKRLNVVISRNAAYSLCAEGPRLASDLTDAVKQLDDATPVPIDKTFIIGGATIYEQSIALEPEGDTGFVDRILLTRIVSPAFEDCDTFFPNSQGNEIGAEWKQTTHGELEEWVGFEIPAGVQNENGVEYEFQMWTRGV